MIFSLRHNFIADMPGPSFLFLFVTAIIIAHIVCWQWRQMADPTAGQSPPTIPPSPDPYGIAYLRGGANEATRLAALALIQRGVLEVTEETKAKNFQISTPQPPTLRRVPNASVGNLLPAEEALYEATRTPLLASEIFGTTGVSTKVNRQFKAVQQFLENEELLTTPALRAAITTCNWWAAGLLLLLGSYKLVDALIEGRHNIGFLSILLCVVPLSFIPARAPRLTAKGRAYLKQLQTAFHGLPRAPSLVSESGNFANDAAATLILSVAIFGTMALQGVAFADYNRMFPKAPTANSAGCGGSSGCGSSSCGSSGCGGGGCGGGGCGGGCGGG